VVIVIRETSCLLIFLFMKLVHWFYLPEMIFFQGTYCLRFFVRKICCMLFFLLLKLELWKVLLLVNLILFKELVAYWFLFVMLVTCWFFPMWHLYINFSFRETDFAQRAFAWIFLVELVACWFLLQDHVARWFISYWNFYFFHRGMDFFIELAA